MVGNPIVVKMIESTIDKTIRDIKNNPKKGVNNLVDLANRFASSPVQQDLVKTLKTILSNSNNPYYNIIPSLINHVNHHTIKTFIINMTYNSWSYGGKKIKQYKKTYNYDIPCTIVFDFTHQSDLKLNNDKIINIIEQGKKMGIYTYMFFIDKIDQFSDILKHNADCAFILFVSPAILTNENISKINSYHNTFFSVLYEATININVFKDTTKLLYDNQCLFGSYIYYSNENIEHILSNKWINEVITIKSPFGILIESQNCSSPNATLIHDYIYNSKANQEYPTLLIDLYEDITKVSRELSENPCLLKIMANGDIRCIPSNINKIFNINNMTLLDIISKL